MNTVPINESRTVNRFALVRNLNAPVAPGIVNAVFNASLWDKAAHDAMIKCALQPRPCSQRAKGFTTS